LKIDVDDVDAQDLGDDGVVLEAALGEQLNDVVANHLVEIGLVLDLHQERVAYMKLAGVASHLATDAFVDGFEERGER
jgi:hypothetical protein